MGIKNLRVRGLVTVGFRVIPKSIGVSIFREARLIRALNILQARPGATLTNVRFLILAVE